MNVPIGFFKEQATSIAALLKKLDQKGRNRRERRHRRRAAVAVPDARVAFLDRKAISERPVAASPNLAAAAKRTGFLVG